MLSLLPLLCGALMATPSVIAGSGKANSNPPHLLVLVVDDWGWHNAGWHAGPNDDSVQTPHLDALVKAGVELNRHYVHRACTPSRSALQSGRLPVHVLQDLVGPCDRIGALPRNITGIAEVLRDGAGYATHFVGKWDAGMATPKHTPQGRGHESSLNYFSHGNWAYTQAEWGGSERNASAIPLPGIIDLWDTDAPASHLNGTKHEEYLFRDRFLSIIEEHAAKVRENRQPLLLQYHSKLAHYPLQAPEEYLARFSHIADDNRRVYAAMISFLDDQVGELVNAFKKHGLWEETLMIATSDNGGYVLSPNGPCNTTEGGYAGTDVGHGTACFNGEAGGNNYPLRGGKYSWFEGGIRVNAFASGGLIPEELRGTKEESIVHIADWFGTFCKLAGIADCQDRRALASGLPGIDSCDQRRIVGLQNVGYQDSEIKGGANALPSTRTSFLASPQVLISGDLKYIAPGTKLSEASWSGPVYPNATTAQDPVGAPGNAIICGHKGCLFNVTADPTEHIDLAAGAPAELLSRLDRELKQAAETVWSPPAPGHGEDPMCRKVAAQRYGGFFGPFQEI